MLALSHRSILHDMDPAQADALEEACGEEAAIARRRAAKCKGVCAVQSDGQDTLNECAIGRIACRIDSDGDLAWISRARSTQLRRLRDIRI